MRRVSIQLRGLSLLFGVSALATATVAALSIRSPAPGLTQPLPPSLCHAAPIGGDVPTTLAGWAAGAQLFDGLGTFHRALVGGVPEAQLYFDQGMRWLWAFNHDEATRSFARAAEADPGCAMCFWGIALAIGPNYNVSMMSAPRGQVAYAAMQRALALAPLATPVDRALIAALAKRYPSASAISASNYDRLQIDYADAMLEVANRFANDDDVLTLAAEALMGEHAWRLWSLEGKPAPGTTEILALLERVLARNPAHPGANHYYIHAIEASPDPGRAEAAADRLGQMMPSAGHLVHMPSHIYQRIGRYADAAAVNDTAARADLAYFQRTRPLDYYAGYTSHNWKFEAFAAVEIGRRGEAMAATRHARALFSDADLVRAGETGWGMGTVYFVPARFGDWDAILAAPAPDARLPGLTAAWLWARGTALAATGYGKQAAGARSALAAIAAAARSGDEAGFNPLKSMYRLALLTLDARIAAAAGNQTQRLRLLTEAVAVEDDLAYDEPSDWPVPVRSLLGRALLDNRRAAEAEAVYREDLRRRPDNGWSLLGLSQALSAEGKPADARTARAAFEKSWVTADTKPSYSAF